MLERLKQFREVFNWGWLAYRIIWILIATGIASAIGGGVWAVLLGVPLPIAIMAAYCTLVGAVYLGLAPLAYRALVQVPAKIPVTKQPRKPEPPNYTAVRLLHEYQLGDASRLWCDMDQRETATYDSESWFQVLRAAIQRGELPFIPKYTAQHGAEKKEPTFSTRVSRVELKKYAAKIDQDPIFLRDS